MEVIGVCKVWVNQAIELSPCTLFKRKKPENPGFTSVWLEKCDPNSHPIKLKYCYSDTNTLKIYRYVKTIFNYF